MQQLTVNIHINTLEILDSKQSQVMHQIKEYWYCPSSFALLFHAEKLSLRKGF